MLKYFKMMSLVLLGFGLFWNSTSLAKEISPTQPPMTGSIKILFLHHSTGECIWNGGVNEWFEQYNQKQGAQYRITERAFPADQPYGWNNYPYDYWNIWVNHAGKNYYKKEPTLEILASQGYKVIIWKHCFPVSDIEEDSGQPEISSDTKSLENYRLQYRALKEKMRKFPDIRFLVWTGAAKVKNDANPESAQRAREFFNWVKTSWDEPGDNIYLWDFYELETEGGLYLKEKYAASQDDSHPNEAFSQTVAPYFCQRIVAVIEGKGDIASITGK